MQKAVYHQHGNLAVRSKLEPEPNTRRKEPQSEKASQNTSQDSEEKPAAEELPEKPLAEAQPELGTWGDGRGEDELSPEEIQMFEQENQRLIGEMNSLFDEAIKNNAGFRVWILFFLVMCSFSLLFLDWYDS
ncbi:hypothetical protein A6R68_02645 [Neotoma lepida]|uniref:Uncharacterized protein n=1 Tax=Neotoma lepida TaxID=56216 RepID=A0A1A6GSD7_NEOLE|nr:hypothetical protein A6R68_02645 [Neotoma lepida]